MSSHSAIETSLDLLVGGRASVLGDGWEGFDTSVEFSQILVRGATVWHERLQAFQHFEEDEVEVRDLRIKKKARRHTKEIYPRNKVQACDLGID